MRRTWLLLLVTCWSCGEQQEPVSEENSWQQAPIEKVNNDPPITEAHNGTGQNVNDQEEDLLIEKGGWGKEESKRSFLYVPAIDSLVEQKNKSLDRSVVRSDGWNATVDVLGEKFIKGLSARELVYYCLAFPAYSAQNCTAFPIPEDGGKYFARFFPVEHHISAVQVSALRQKRDSVCILLKKLLAEKSTIHIEVLDLIHRANLTELVPYLCKKASFSKNPYVYTLLINMMNSNHYTAFTQSTYYNGLLQNVHPNGSIIAKRPDADSLVQYALKFYRSTTPK